MCPIKIRSKAKLSHLPPLLNIMEGQQVKQLASEISHTGWKGGNKHSQH